MKRVSILWHKGGMSGKLELTNAGKLNISEFALRENEHRLDIEIDGAKLTNGAFATVLTVRARENPFSFFVRDVRSDYPIYIREYEVAVTDAEDCRTYEEITKDIASKCLRSKIDMFEQEPEESFETAAAKSRSMRAPTWLGISRDIRMFEVAAHQVANDSALWDTVTPMNHHSRVRYEEMGDIPIEFNYFAGRGIGCRYDLKRRLEKGVLPILNVVSLDDDMRYEHQMFVTNEIRPLKIENVEGTHYLISDKYAVAPTKRTPEQQAETDRIHDSEMYRDEETVLYLKVTAINTAKVPRYCFMRLPQINVHAMTELTRNPMTFEEGLNAFSSTGNVVMTSTLNSEPFGEIDSSILLTPGEKATFVFKIPHRPIPKERAEALIKTDYDAKLKECIAFWEKKLESMAKISLPEKRIEEMMKAGYLHLDLVCFGKEPDDAVAPVVGVYTPIGTESTPIIQYFEAVGNNKLAQRSIMYFMKKQRDDGFMQNFQTYMSETGPALWNAGEHYKITRDKEWLES
ncbi:MAG: hypothetical protein GX633_10390, partial [Clostridiales bacterium]|nr:hypothetical protein [Clostridiales bacterium]